MLHRYLHHTHKVIEAEEKRRISGTARDREKRKAKSKPIHRRKSMDLRIDHPFYLPNSNQF